MVGNGPSEFQTLVGLFPNVSNTLQALPTRSPIYTLWPFPKESPISLSHRLLGLQQPVGTFLPCLHINGQFLFICLKVNFPSNNK